MEGGDPSIMFEITIKMIIRILGQSVDEKGWKVTKVDTLFFLEYTFPIVMNPAGMISSCQNKIF